jgi:hypothetical protein
MARTEFQPGPETSHYHATVGVDEVAAPYRVVIELTADQINAMGSEDELYLGAVAVLDAPGEGKIIIPTRVTSIYRFGETSYNDEFDFILVPGEGAEISTEIDGASININIGADADHLQVSTDFGAGGAISELANKPLSLVAHWND